MLNAEQLRDAPLNAQIEFWIGGMPRGVKGRSLRYPSISEMWSSAGSREWGDTILKFSRSDAGPDGFATA